MTVKHDGKTLTLTQEPYIDTVLNMRIGDTVEVIDGALQRPQGTYDAQGLRCLRGEEFAACGIRGGCMIDHGIGTQTEIQKILAAFQPGEMVTAAVIAKRCELSIARSARTLAAMRDGGMLVYKLDPTNRQRWVYRLPEVVA